MSLLDRDAEDRFEFWASVICSSIPVFCIICNAVDILYRFLVNVVS